MIAWSYGDTELERFWRKVAKGAPEECWAWRGRPNKKGYGRYCFNKRIILAHRAAYLLLVGPVPDGLYVLHQCDNPICVNPGHLFLGTIADNNADMRAKGRGVNPPAMVNSGTWAVETVRGERHPRVKLTDDQVRAFLAACDRGEELTPVAKRFGISVSYACKLRSREAPRIKDL